MSDTLPVAFILVNLIYRLQRNFFAAINRPMERTSRGYYPVALPRPPIHPLKRWLFEHGLTQAEFSERSGVSQGYLTELLSWRKRPSLDITDAISRATGGEVTAVDFTKEPQA
jgi:hypothetical protein